MDPIRNADLICFDNDGTLFVSDEVANPAIQRCFVLFARQHGLDLPAPSDEEICKLTGKPGPEFYSEILPQELRELAPRFRDLCLDEEVREVLARGRLYPGIEDLLRGLRAAGTRTALVSNGGERYIAAVAERAGYGGLLDGIYHFGRNGLLRKADMIRTAARELGAATAVMVGDRASDRDAAVEAGVPFIGCLYGYGTSQELGGAQVLVRNPGELARALLDTLGSPP